MDGTESWGEMSRTFCWPKSALRLMDKVLTSILTSPFVLLFPDKRLRTILSLTFISLSVLEDVNFLKFNFCIFCLLVLIGENEQEMKEKVCRVIHANRGILKSRLDIMLILNQKAISFHWWVTFIYGWPFRLRSYRQTWIIKNTFLSPNINIVIKMRSRTC